MSALNVEIDTLTESVLSGTATLDDALGTLKSWVRAYSSSLSETDRRIFSASLEAESTGDDRSLIDSVLKLHATRLLFRLDQARRPVDVQDSDQTTYARARRDFDQALAASEDAINEARFDIAIANAHHLLGGGAANRRWLDAALDRLPDLAATDLVELAESIPAMPLPPAGPLKRLGLKLIGFNFSRLNENNRASLVTIARMQISQVAILAYLLGTSYEAIRERSRANRAFRVAAHLIVRHQGLSLPDADQLLAIAKSLQRTEPEAARLLAEQARTLYKQAANADGVARASDFLAV